MNAPAKDVDTYLSLLPEDQRAALEKLRRQIKAIAPDAEECISYGVPMFKYHGNLVGFGAAKSHCSFYAANNTAVERYKDELKDFDIAKGTIRFTAKKPIPAVVIKKIVKDKIQANLAKAKGKKK